MEFPAKFSPIRRSGLILHTILISLFSVTGGLSLWIGLQRTESANIIGGLLFSVVLLLPIPFLIYRAYALLQASYLLDRDGLRVRWGLRSEDIPMPGVEWIRPANELGYTLRLPIIRWPGSIFGKRNTEGLGNVEFLASDRFNLLLIATPEKVYAISPQDTSRFINTFRSAVELGSLAPISSSTTLPAAYLKRIWSDIAARWLVFGGALATSLLAVITSALVANNPELPMGFDPQGQPFPPGPSQYVLLLPILGAITFAGDLLMGMFFYRRNETQPISYLLWAGAILTALLLCIAVFLIAK